jgi:putative oxidoreductase
MASTVVDPVGEGRLVRAVRIALGLVFVVAGSVLAAGGLGTGEPFDEMGAGVLVRVAVGLLQVAGGVGLLVPLLAGAAATGLTMLMVGAVVTDLAQGRPPVAALVVLGVTIWLAAALRSRTVSLVRALRRRR